VRNYAVEAAARPVETGLAYDLPPRLRSGHAGVTWVGRFSSLCGSGVLNQTGHDGSIRFAEWLPGYSVRRDFPQGRHLGGLVRFDLLQPPQGAADRWLLGTVCLAT
jgi:hypothetical protein